VGLYSGCRRKLAKNGAISVCLATVLRLPFAALFVAGGEVAYLGVNVVGRAVEIGFHLRGKKMQKVDSGRMDGNLNSTRMTSAILHFAI
jgi:hypothetical protein